ncbi:MAG: beta-lactamase family protein [Patescibacteria group bacterium]|nr:beta-lactamase family protein [Patescibacteria group bacterium]
MTDNPRITDLDKLVDNIFKNYASKATTAGFSIALINGTQVNQYNYGETKLGNKTLPNNQTLYEIGSITKTFTSAALIYWLNQNNITINSAVKSYLPSYLSSNLTKNGVDVSFKHLLNHTSGMPRIPNDLPNSLDPYLNYDSIKVYNYIKNHSLLRIPGTFPTTEQEAFDFYSNLAYSLAGLILERQNHNTLESIFRSIIFAPLNMNNSTLNDIETINNRAYPHNSTNNALYWHISGTAGAGGIKSCLADMIKYAQAQINASNTNMLGESFLENQIPQIQINGKDYFGLGWEFYFTKSNKRITVKDGGTGGFTAFIAFEKTSQKAIVALFNNHNSNNPSEPFINLLEEYFK